MLLFFMNGQSKLHLSMCVKSKKKTQDDDAEKWVELIKQYSNPTELTTELLNSLIEKIVVHEAVKSPDGCRKQKVDIYYRFIGKID